MKNKIENILLILILLVSTSAISQITYPAEKAVLVCDRGLYVSGEHIQISGEINMVDDSEILSEIVYVELITPLGQKINQMKLRITNSHFEGALLIPDAILSGYYFLRAYTKWMRNGDPSEYTYQLLKIVNPHHKDVLQIPDSLILEDEDLMTPNEDLLTKESYHPEESIRLDLHSSAIPKWDWLSIGLIPANTKNLRPFPPQKNHSSYSEITYFPETRGLSMSGNILINGTVAPYHRINVNVLGKNDFIAVLSDSLGRFHLSLPDETGEKELFVIAESSAKQGLKINIDMDFCTKAFSMATPRFMLSNEEKSSLLLMAQHQQILSFYNDSVISVDDIDSPVSFYDKAFKIIDFNFYIQLDSLEQYFTDIPSWVQVKRRKGKRYLQVMGDQSELQVYPPLLMVDWVPIDEADRILALNPSQVKQIEIIKDPYLYGDHIYGGIIHLKTRNQDFGGLKFPETGMYLTYQFLAAVVASTSNKLPFKNTWYWNTLSQYDSQNEMNIPAPSLKGKYLLMIQGIDTKGEMIQLSQDIIIE